MSPNISYQFIYYMYFNPLSTPNSVQQYKKAYVACAKAQKPVYAKVIYDEIRAMVPPGRFLKQDPKTKLWNDIGEKKALDKTRQALREGAPTMLKDMGGCVGGGDDGGNSVADDHATSRPNATGPLNMPWQDAAGDTPNYEGRWNPSIAAAAFQLRARQQQMQLTSQAEFIAQLQLLKLQLQANAQCTIPDAVNQGHRGGVRGGIESDDNGMGNDRNLDDVLATGQTQNFVGSENTMHTNGPNSLADNFQTIAGRLGRIYNDSDNASRAAYQFQQQQQQQQIAQFALLNATRIYDSERTSMISLLGGENYRFEQQQQQQQQQQPSRRPGSMRNSGPNSDSFTRAHRISTNNNSFKNRRPGREQNQSLGSSFSSLKSSIMSVEALSLDDLDGTEMIDVFDNR
ncbi:hypothetical protein ACHAXA_001025 [Cyclostephanos tholiformis]|uniref:DUF6824 domain-containing protein n=1 Tax=Cyclostephanos tholiformis TaxID=382380 RepID=A0ABD3RW48_9STRA